MDETALAHVNWEASVTASRGGPTALREGMVITCDSPSLVVRRRPGGGKPRGTPPSQLLHGRRELPVFAAVRSRSPQSLRPLAYRTGTHNSEPARVSTYSDWGGPSLPPDQEVAGSTPVRRTTRTRTRAREPARSRPACIPFATRRLLGVPGGPRTNDADRQGGGDGSAGDGGHGVA